MRNHSFGEGGEFIVQWRVNERFEFLIYQRIRKLERAYQKEIDAYMIPFVLRIGLNISSDQIPITIYILQYKQMCGNDNKIYIIYAFSLVN